MKSDTPSTIQVEVFVNGQVWKEVDTLNNYGPDDPCYTLDAATGTVTFGDGRNGRIPTPGQPITTTFNYRMGGGDTGNVLSFTWAAINPDSQSALAATITTLPRSIQVSVYQGTQHSWRWRFVTWLCGLMKVRLLAS